MLFVFHILVFLIINYTEINCFVLRNNELVKQKYDSRIVNPQDIEDASRNKSHASSPKQMFKIIQNLTNVKTSNLKSNVFDKMLSDEMLSMKKHFYEKDISHVSLQLTNKPTPTLDIQQKWPYTDDESKDNINSFKLTRHNNSYPTSERNDSINTLNEILIKTDTVNEENISKRNLYDKILELRSLSEDFAIRRLQNVHSVTNLCTKTVTPVTCTQRCTKTTPHCSQQCTGSTPNYSQKCTGSTTHCTHSCSRRCSSMTSCCTQSKTPSCTHSSANNCYLCTRPSNFFTTLQPAYYVTFPNYIFAMSTKKSKNNYHSYVIDDIHLPKKMKRKKKKKTTRHYYMEDLYYDHKEIDNIENRVSDYSENYENIRQTNEDNELVNRLKYNKNIKENKQKQMSQDELVSKVANDLKMYYSDVVIKDCYCASMSVDRKFSWLCVLFTLFVFLITNTDLLQKQLLK